ncbi:MAG: SprT-like domain-containing protein [Candidatus Paceibacterota bacterium]
MSKKPHRESYKIQLEKVTRLNRSNTFEPTITDCKKWFRIINQEIFKNRLEDVKMWNIKRRRGVWAYYYCDSDTSGILMNNKYNSKQDFVNILSHEMIHHYQNQFDKPLGHGPSFSYWKPLFSKKGLILTKRY